MNNQHEVKLKQKLLNASGNIAEAGYAKTFVWQYDRKDIKASKSLIKEWDYYYIGNDDYALCVTLADMGYIGAFSASVIDFKNAWQITKSNVILFPMGKLKMPSSTEVGGVSYNKNGFKVTFENDGTARRVLGVYPKFGNKKEDLIFDVTLTDNPKESMVIATPFLKKGRFYLNQKINCLNAEGSFSLGENGFRFSKENNSLATLDWGRGVWTYDNTWYWGSLQTVLDNGKKFGFNIGYGFGVNKSTENMLFYDGLSHKLDEITFNIPKKNGKDDYMSPWTFTSNDKRFEMDFKPIIDRYAPVNLGFFAMLPHQVFGLFSGKAVLDNGEVIELKDVLGFAEKVRNKW